MKRLIISLVGGVAGIVALLAGLGIDAWLHTEDETLAAREGIFTLTNPGHALLALGIALACGGILSALHAAWGMASASGKFGHASVRHAALGGSVVASVGAIVFALAVSSSGQAHGGDDAQVHDASQPHMDAHVAVVAGDGAALAPPQAGDSSDSDMNGMAMSNDMETETAADSANPHVVTNDQHTASPLHAHDIAAPLVASSNAAAPAAVAVAGDATHAHITDEMMQADGGTDAGTMSASTDSHTRDTPQPTADETACMARLTEETRAATARFADYDVALAEGYVQNPGKVGANHYPNRAYTLDGKIMELSQPETLIYKTDAAGDRTLVGVMFKAAKGQAGPTPCGAASHWHTHTNCVDPATKAEVDETASGICPAGYNLRESGEMIHIWFVEHGQRKSA